MASTEYLRQVLNRFVSRQEDVQLCDKVINLDDQQYGAFNFGGQCNRNWTISRKQTKIRLRIRVNKARWPGRILKSR